MTSPESAELTSTRSDGHCVRDQDGQRPRRWSAPRPTPPRSWHSSRMFPTWGFESTKAPWPPLTRAPARRYLLAVFPPWFQPTSVRDRGRLGPRMSTKSFASTPGPSVAPRDGDPESLTPGRRKRADRRPRASLVLDDAPHDDWAHTIIDTAQNHGNDADADVHCPVGTASLSCRSRSVSASRLIRWGVTH